MTGEDALGEPGQMHGGLRDPEAHALRSAESSAERLVRRVHAVADHIADVRRAVLAFAREHGASSAALPDIALAVSEACTNVVMHAYIDAAPGPLNVEAYHENGELVVIVADEGRGMAPRPDSPGLGLGLTLIARLADRVEVTQHTPTGTKLQMTFAVSGAS